MWVARVISLFVVATQTYHLSEIKKDNITEGSATCPSVSVGRPVTCEGEEYDSKADIQRWGSILAWIVILSF
jgi:hypothetical protein